MGDEQDPIAALRAQMMAGAQLMVELWPVYLDALDGLVAQTVARGWPEDQARRIVVSYLTAHTQPPPHPPNAAPEGG